MGEILDSWTLESNGQVFCLYQDAVAHRKLFFVCFVVSSLGLHCCCRGLALEPQQFVLWLFHWCLPKPACGIVSYH